MSAVPTLPIFEQLRIASDDDANQRTIFERGMETLRALDPRGAAEIDTFRRTEQDAVKLYANGGQLGDAQRAAFEQAESDLSAKYPEVAKSGGLPLGEYNVRVGDYVRALGVINGDISEAEALQFYADAPSQNRFRSVVAQVSTSPRFAGVRPTEERGALSQAVTTVGRGIEDVKERGTQALQMTAAGMVPDSMKDAAAVWIDPEAVRFKADLRRARESVDPNKATTMFGKGAETALRAAPTMFAGAAATIAGGAFGGPAGAFAGGTLFAAQQASGDAYGEYRARGLTETEARYTALVSGALEGVIEQWLPFDKALLPPGVLNNLTKGVRGRVAEVAKQYGVNWIKENIEEFAQSAVREGVGAAAGFISQNPEFKVQSDKFSWETIGETAVATALMLAPGAALRGTQTALRGPTAESVLDPEYIAEWARQNPEMPIPEKMSQTDFNKLTGLPKRSLNIEQREAWREQATEAQAAALAEQAAAEDTSTSPEAIAAEERGTEDRPFMLPSGVRVTFESDLDRALYAISRNPNTKRGKFLIGEVSSAVGITPGDVVNLANSLIPKVEQAREQAASQGLKKINIGQLVDEKTVSQEWRGSAAKATQGTTPAPQPGGAASPRTGVPNEGQTETQAGRQGNEEGLLNPAASGNIEAAPGVQTATGAAKIPEPDPTDTFRLSPDLKGAKPRYGLGQWSFELDFKSDLDKAAYILAQNIPSKRDADYLRSVMNHVGITEPEARALGSLVKAELKNYARDAKQRGEKVVSVPPIAWPMFKPKQEPVQPPEQSPTPTPDQIATTDAQSSVGGGIEQPVVGGTDKPPVVGDYVQWEPQGVAQFAEPKPIKSISPEGNYAFFEGSMTGVPIAELRPVPPVVAENATSEPPIAATAPDYGSMTKEEYDAQFPTTPAPARFAGKKTVYHGSDNPLIESFSVDPAKLGSSTGAKTAKLGAFFSENPTVAKWASGGFNLLNAFSKFSGGGIPTLYAVKLDLKNPLDLNNLSVSDLAKLEQLFPGITKKYNKAGDKFEVLRHLAKYEPERTTESFAKFAASRGYSSERASKAFKDDSDPLYSQWYAANYGPRESAQERTVRLLRSMGHDGISVKTFVDSPDAARRQYVVFDANSIHVMRSTPISEHSFFVENKLKRGEPVPSLVLAQYPHLAKKYPGANQTSPTVAPTSPSKPPSAPSKPSTKASSDPPYIPPGVSPPPTGKESLQVPPSKPPAPPKPPTTGDAKPDRFFGRPDLANPMKSKSGRDAMDRVDQARNEAGKPGKITNAEVETEARRRLTENYAEWRQRVYADGLVKDVYDAGTLDLLLNMEHERAESDPKAMGEWQVQASRRRDQRSDLARQMQFGRDRIMSPAQRKAKQIRDAFQALPGWMPQKTEADIRKSGEEWGKVVAKVKESLRKKLKADNIDFDAILSPDFGVVEKPQATEPDADPAAIVEEAKLANRLSAAWKKFLDAAGKFGHMGVQGGIPLGGSGEVLAAAREVVEAAIAVGINDFKKFVRVVARKFGKQSTIDNAEMWATAWNEASNAENIEYPQTVADVLAPKKAKKKKPGLEQLDHKTYAYIMRAIAAEKGGNFWDASYTIMLANMLSAPRTLGVNFAATGAFASYVTFAERFIEASGNDFMRSLGYKPKGARLGEFKHMMRVAMPALQEAAQNALAAFDTELPVFDDMGGAVEDYQKSIAAFGRNPTLQFAGRQIRIPLRALLAGDEFNKTFFGTMDVVARAYRTAKDEGLDGDALEDRMEEIVADKDSAEWQEAMEYARTVAFQSRKNPLIRTALEGKRHFGLRWQFPFVLTPGNIFIEGAAKRSALAVPYYIAKAIKGKATGSDLAKLASATIASAIVWSLLSGDKKDEWITGTPDINDATRKFQRQMEQPYSVKIKGQWVSYAWLEPFATVIAQTVDGIKAMKDGGGTAGLLASIKSLMIQAGDKTFLENVGNFYRAANTVITSEDTNEGFKDAFKRLAGDFVTQLTPALLRQIVASRREYRPAYERDTTLGNLETRLGIKEGYPQRTLWGDPVPPYVGPENEPAKFAWRSLTPTTIIDPRTAFIGDRILLDYYHDENNNRLPGEMPRSWTDRLDPKGDKRVRMTDAQVDAQAKYAGLVAKAAVAEWNPEQKAENAENIIGILNLARDVVRNRMIPQWRKGETGEVDVNELGSLVLGMYKMRAFNALKGLPSPSIDDTPETFSEDVEAFKLDAPRKIEKARGLLPR